jgi:hypothetical protein
VLHCEINLFTLPMSSSHLEEGGYPDTLFIGSHSCTLNCSICFKVIRNGVRACKNDHYYCNDCLRKHLRVNQKTCPDCREKIQANKALQPARLLNTQISELPVKCYMNNGNIGEQGVLPRRLVLLLLPRYLPLLLI